MSGIDPSSAFKSVHFARQLVDFARPPRHLSVQAFHDLLNAAIFARLRHPVAVCHVTEHGDDLQAGTDDRSACPIIVLEVSPCALQ